LSTDPRPLAEEIRPLSEPKTALVPRPKPPSSRAQIVLILSLSKDARPLTRENPLSPSHNRCMAWVYILHCADGSFYTGITRADLEKRVAEHAAGSFGGYTKRRRPVTLVWADEFPVLTDALAAERRIKGWRRAKKLALINRDFEALRRLARNRARQSTDVDESENM
jgi:predicted GIY-YIG superfamily endonuclease